MRTDRITRSRRARRPALLGALGLIVMVLVAPLTALHPAAAQTSDGVRITRGVTMATTEAGPLVVDIYQPEEGGSGRPAVVLIHGGAWFQGAPADMDEQGRLLARQGWVGFSISYRLAKLGQPSWPGNLSDVQRGIRWVAAHAADYGATADRLAVLGSSAGAHLAALVASVGVGVAGPDEAGGTPPPPTPATTPPPPSAPAAPGSSIPGAPTPVIKAVALWSPPTELRDLVPEGDQPPAACGDNDYCRTFWTVPFIPTMLGCVPTECSDLYEQASPPTWVSRSTVPVWLANSEDEIVPIGQLQSLADALADARVDHQVKVLEGHQHANEYTASVWNDMVPFLSTRLGVSTPAPINFPAPVTTTDAGLVAAVAGLTVLAGISFGAVIIRSRRHRPVP